MENESKYPVLRYHVDAKLDGDALIYQPGVCDDMAKTFLAFQEASEYAALASWGFRREDVVRALEEADRLRAENAELREQVRQLETRARTERCDAADYDCRELGALRREVSSLPDSPEKKKEER